jgi:hypothetical protein
MEHSSDLCKVIAACTNTQSLASGLEIEIGNA